jgi:DNA polymerase-3 subunit delta'
LNNHEIIWLTPLVQAWRDAATAARAPHAVMLTGSRGVGKRALAAWIVGERLQLEPTRALPLFPIVLPEHPDLYWLRPPEDKRAIGIDQIRELVADLGLTSHGSLGKVAVIDPADSMTANAANSLLKTLEEPPGNTLMILITDRAGKLPATVLSRCQRMHINLPPELQSLSWLDTVRPGTHWGAALQLASGAPLAAIGAHELIDRTAAMARDFGGIAEGRVSPIDTAARWAKDDPEFVLNWIGRQVQRSIHRASGTAPAATDLGVSETVLKRIDRRKLFCYLDIINGLRGQPAGSFNVQLTLESLLIDWARGLVHCGQGLDPEVSLPSGAG